MSRKHLDPVKKGPPDKKVIIIKSGKPVLTNDEIAAKNLGKQPGPGKKVPKGQTPRNPSQPEPGHESWALYPWLVDN